MMNIEETLKYLAGLCEDFENQGEHFEFTQKDADVIKNLVNTLNKEDK